MILWQPSKIDSMKIYSRTESGGDQNIVQLQEKRTAARKQSKDDEPVEKKVADSYHGHWEGKLDEQLYNLMGLLFFL